MVLCASTSGASIRRHLFLGEWFCISRGTAHDTDLPRGQATIEFHGGNVHSEGLTSGVAWMGAVVFP